MCVENVTFGELKLSVAFWRTLHGYSFKSWISWMRQKHKRKNTAQLRLIQPAEHFHVLLFWNVSAFYLRKISNFLIHNRILKVYIHESDLNFFRGGNWEFCTIHYQIMAAPYCIICHNTFIQSEEIASTRCGHVYHNECLKEWFQA